MDLGATGSLTLAGKIKFLKFETTKKGTEVAEFQMSRKMYRGQGNDAEWVNYQCKVFGKDVDAMRRFGLKDGDVVCVVGDHDPRQGEKGCFHNVFVRSIAILHQDKAGAVSASGGAAQGDDDSLPFD